MGSVAVPFRQDAWPLAQAALSRFETTGPKADTPTACHGIGAPRCSEASSLEESPASHPKPEFGGLRKRYLMNHPMAQACHNAKSCNARLKSRRLGAKDPRH